MAKRIIDPDKPEISIEDAVLLLPCDVKQRLKASGKNVDSAQGLMRLYHRNEKVLFGENMRSMRADAKKRRKKLEELDRLEKRLTELERPWKEALEKYEKTARRNSKLTCDK